MAKHSKDFQKWLKAETRELFKKNPHLKRQCKFVPLCFHQNKWLLPSYRGEAG